MVKQPQYNSVNHFITIEIDGAESPQYSLSYLSTIGVVFAQKIMLENFLPHNLNSE